GLRGARVPAPREQPLGLHALDRDVHGHVLVALVGDLAADARARREGVLENGSEPLAELLRVGERQPYFGAWVPESDLFLDAIRRGRAHLAAPRSADCPYAIAGLHVSPPGRDMQPQSCLLEHRDHRPGEVLPRCRHFACGLAAQSWRMWFASSS